MHHVSDSDVVPVVRGRRPLTILLWLAVSICLAVSIFSLIEEMCLATACRDTASFTFFGVGIGWIGIAYFSLMLLVLWLRQKKRVLGIVLTALVFSGVGAELRLLWIQKYIIGSWCPLCVTISCALFCAALVLSIEKVQIGLTGQDRGKSLPRWLAFVSAMIATGLALAVAGIHELV